MDGGFKSKSISEEDCSNSKDSFFSCEPELVSGDRHRLLSQNFTIILNPSSRTPIADISRTAGFVVVVACPVRFLLKQ
jgi:hypothetical protein